MQAGCAAVQKLAAAVQPERLQAHLEALLGALLPGLSHAHSKVRLAVLAATSALAAQVKPVQGSLLVLDTLHGCLARQLHGASRLQVRLQSRLSHRPTAALLQT